VKKSGELEQVPVARMVNLVWKDQIQYAYSYKSPLSGAAALAISRGSRGSPAIPLFCGMFGRMSIRVTGNHLYEFPGASDKKFVFGLPINQ